MIGTVNNGRAVPTLTIDDLRLSASVGVYARERRGQQPIVINLAPGATRL